MTSKVIFYVPVKKRYISDWEYYQVDYDVLKDLYGKVVVCSSFWEVLKNLKGAKLIFCWWWHRSVLVVMLAWLLGIKTQVTGAIHMFDLSGATDFFSKSYLYRIASRLCLAIADANLFISQDQFTQVTSHLKVKNPVLVYSSLTKGTNLNYNYNGNFSKNKNQHFQFATLIWHTLDQYRRKGIFETLQALSILNNKSDVSFTWIIAGASGPGVEYLRSKVFDLGLNEFVDIRTDLSREEKGELYTQSDLYLQPSWCEGFGNAVMEAMSYGLPALVSRYTAQPEVVGQFGFIAMEMSASSILENLEKFLVLSKKERETLSMNVIDWVAERFTFEVRLERIAFLSSEMGISTNLLET